MRFAALAIALTTLLFAACGDDTENNFERGRDLASTILNTTPASPSPTPVVTFAAVTSWRDVPQLRDAVLECSERPYHIIANWDEDQGDWISPGIGEDSDDFIARVTLMNDATKAAKENFSAIADWLVANYPGSARDLFLGFIDPDWSPLMYDCVAQSLS